MAKNSSGIRTLKGGKVSIQITEKVKTILLSAIEFRIAHLENIDELRTVILKEIWIKLNEAKNRLKLLRHEFVCLFEKEMIELIPEHLQVLIIATVNPDFRVIELK